VDQDTFHARRAELVVEELDGELLVYDLRTDAAHSLDVRAAAIWRACDGGASIAEIAAATGTAPEIVEHTLSDLSDRALLEGRGQISRRDAVRRMALTAGAAAVAVPVVRSIVAPTAAQAQTCLPDGAPCTSDGQCCGGNCDTGTNTCQSL
jgi:hypothetical protein